MQGSRPLKKNKKNLDWSIFGVCLTHLNMRWSIKKYWGSSEVTQAKHFEWGLTSGQPKGLKGWCEVRFWKALQLPSSFDSGKARLHVARKPAKINGEAQEVNSRACEASEEHILQPSGSPQMMVAQIVIWPNNQTLRQNPAPSPIWFSNPFSTGIVQDEICCWYKLLN